MLYLGVIPVVYFYPNIAIILIICIFFFAITVNLQSPRPLFESIKARVKRGDRDVLPFLYIGDDEMGFPVEIPASAMKQHMLLVGSTGSGKTSLLRRMIDTQLRYGGGCCFVDGKADTADMYQVFFSEVVANDREEDFYLLNFFDPLQSHTFNPFLYGDSDFIVEVLNGLLKEAQGDNVYWQERAITMMRAYMGVLVWLRDNRKDFVLNVSTINNHMSLAEISKLATDPDIPDFDKKTGKPVRHRLRLYLDSLSPSWEAIFFSEKLSKDLLEEKAEMVRQFGYAVQQWAPAFDLLSAVYGRIFDTTQPDIDVRDVVINNKILYILLPSLKQSPQTLKQLGRLCLSVFRIVFTELLGDSVIGNAEEIRKRTASKKPDPPFLLVLDEYGSYATEGIDVVLAQARSTGVSTIISVQEVASLFKLNEVEAKRLLQNTKIKICLAVDDRDTSRYFVERVGEDWSFVPAVRREFGDFMERAWGNYDGSFSYQKVERLQDLELYGLKPGHGFILYLDEFRKFYSPELKVPRPERMRLIRFVRTVSKDVIAYLRKRFAPAIIDIVVDVVDGKKKSFVINEWDDDEIKQLMQFHNRFGIFPGKLESRIMASNETIYDDSIESYNEFEEALYEEMSLDTGFITECTEPDMDVWNEIKTILLSY